MGRLGQFVCTRLSLRALAMLSESGASLAASGAAERLFEIPARKSADCGTACRAPCRCRRAAMSALENSASPIRAAGCAGGGRVSLSDGAGEKVAIVGPRVPEKHAVSPACCGFYRSRARRDLVRWHPDQSGRPRECVRASRGAAGLGGVRHERARKTSASAARCRRCEVERAAELAHATEFNPPPAAIPGAARRTPA